MNILMKKSVLPALSIVVLLSSAATARSDVLDGSWSFAKGAAAGPCGVISCSNGVFKGESFAMFRPTAGVSNGGIMRISFDASWRDVVPDVPSYSCAGVCMLVEYVDACGRKVHPKNVNIGFGSRARGSYEMEFPVAKGAKSFWVYFGVRWARGAAEFSNLRIRIDPPDANTTRSGAVAGATAAEIVNDSNAGQRIGAAAAATRSFLIETTPPPDWAPPHVADGSGLAFFRVDSPRRTFDRHPPHPSQLQDEFAISATPGETADLFFGVYAEKAAKSLRASAGAFHSSGIPGTSGAAVPAPALFRAHNWMRADGKLGAYTLAPEVLFPLETPQSLPAGTTALLLAQFRVPDDAKPGVYRGEIAIRDGDGATRTAKVALTVLPFRLRRPAPQKHEMIAHGGPYSKDGEPTRVVELFKWLKTRGFESALVPCQYSPGMLELGKDANGRIAIKSFKKLDDALAAYRAAGMTGTFFVHFSDKLEVAVAKATGVSLPDAAGEQTNMVAEMEAPWFKAAAVDALKLVAKRCEGVPLVVLGLDEPNVAARVPRAKWERDRIEEAGLASAIYCSAAAWENVRTMTAISSSAPGSAECGRLAAETAARGGKLYLYCLEGSYGYYFGSAHGSWSGLMPSRHTVGWSEHLTPESRGHTAWLFGTGGTVSDSDEMAPPGWAALTRYDAKGRLLSTLHFEGDCLGIDDYAYLNTLAETLDEKKSHPRHDAIAAEFAALKEEIRANWHPYCLDSADAERPAADGSLRSFLNVDADKARAKVVKWILELM